jgi:hypothetical protein
MAQWPCPRCSGMPPLLLAEPRCLLCHGLPYMVADPRSKWAQIADSRPVWQWGLLLFVGLGIIRQAGCGR